MEPSVILEPGTKQSDFAKPVFIDFIEVGPEQIFEEKEIFLSKPVFGRFGGDSRYPLRYR